MNGFRGLTNLSFSQAAKDSNDENSEFISFLLALVDYSTFISMMREQAGIPEGKYSSIKI